MQPLATVYIIDPDPANHKCVSETATALGAAHAVFSSAEQFLEHCAEAASGDFRGCVVAELRLLGMNGLELQQEMALREIHLPLILHTSHAETRLTVTAMRAGAVSVLDKPASPQDLWDALYGALRRDERERARRSQQRDAQRRLDRLSPKERQVLQLLLDGLPNKVIARRLDVSVRTVEARRSQLFKKTGTRSVAELVRFVLVHTVRAEPASAEGNAPIEQPRVVARGDGRGKASAGTGGVGVRVGGDGNGQASTSPFRGTSRPVVGSVRQLPQVPERSPDLGGSSLGGPCRVQFVD